MEGNSLCTSGTDGIKRKVSYFYEPTIGNYNYGHGHVMKPHRIRVTHSLVLHCGLQNKMDICTPAPATREEMQKFHSDDYVEFLSSVSPEVHGQYAPLTYNVGSDCPAFDGLFEFCQASAGGSIRAATKLNEENADIALNWAGGLHHAKRCAASGFCYVNDIVLAILELLTKHPRVLYIDIDVHHGDGVEEAFFTTDRVMTVSFHKFGGKLPGAGFFPGSGNIKDIGVDGGKYYSLNVPLQDGIDDSGFRSLFHPIIAKVMEVYQPGAVVLQCGADSLSGDRLGCFNLSIKGHADCLNYLRTFNVPLLVLGGGGYTVSNVARCWCYETAVAVGWDPKDHSLRGNEYSKYFGPEYTLDIKTSNMENKNSPKDIENIRTSLLDLLSKIQHTPSVQFQARPPQTESPEEDEEDMDKRLKPGMDTKDL